MIEKKMKIFVSILILTLLVVTSLSASAKKPSERRLMYDAGLETSFPIYGDSGVRDLNSKIQKDGYRAVLGLITDLNLRLTDNLTFFTGADVLFDFIWKDPEYFNHMDFSVFPGFKIYPGLKGFNFSLAYSFGNRFDFFRNDPGTVAAKTGNGFRIGCEYNGSYQNDTYWPSVGLYYKLCPRGNYTYDNYFGMYVVMNF